MGEKKEYIVKYGNVEFPASEYQSAIFDCVEHGIGNMVINAAAGSSKTTTIVNATYYIPEGKKVLFIAFNKDIVEKLKNEITHPKAYVATFHSLGYSILKENKIVSVDEESIVNEYKYTSYINLNVDNISKYGETKSLGDKRQRYMSNIRKLVDYARYYLAFTEREIARVGEIYDITPIRDEYAVTYELLRWGKENLSSIDYTDMIWLPNVLNLNTRKYTSDWIFIDEAQDTSIAEQAMVEKCFKRGTRFCTVGDYHQQINVWAGATEDAINKFKSKPNTREYSLPISYRCPKKIVALAQKYSDNIEAAPQAIEGEINYDISEYDAQGGDMVLCRLTAPLVELHLKYIQRNKKSHIRGGENLKESLKQIIESTHCEYIDRGCITTNGLYPTLYRMILDEHMRVMNLHNLSEEEAARHSNVLRLFDIMDSINALSDGLYTTKDLIDKIDTIFNGDESEAVQLSTIHKAKGLESDNVFILKPSIMENPLGTKEWEIRSEKNLIYVAYTRAKKSLNFIKEYTPKYKEKKNELYSTSLMNRIEGLRKKVGFSNSLGNSEEIMKNVIEKVDNTNIGKISNISKAHKKIGASRLSNLLQKK